MQKRFQVNEMIGEYRVTHFLGEGGMGEVYLGVHEKLGRPAAIKILGASASDPSFKSRFFNEARLQASLHHPHIAALYDFQEQGDELLIFMEYVDGENLDDLIARREFSVSDTLRVFASVCEAVGYIHKNGIVHRDIKSQNIKLTAGGDVKLLDFGIAKGESSHGLTQTGGVIGTPNYLSPEQLEGRPATAQADIWALGVLLYEMLTGTLPFKGDTFAGLVLQITLAQFTPPENVNPGIPRDVASIIKKCLKKDTHSRYRNIDELLGALRAAEGHKQGGLPTIASTFLFKRHEKTPAAPGTIVSEGSDDTAPGTAAPVKRSPVVFIAAGAAALILVVAVIGGLGLWALSGNSSSAAANTAGTTKAPNTNAVQTADLKGGSQHVRVDIDEGKAEVIRNGQVLGTTPLEMDLAIGENPQLTLHRDGFEDKNVQIEVGGGKKVFTFSLKPKN